MILRKVPIKYVAQFYQLNVSYGVVRNYLAMIRVIKTFQYWWCGQSE